MTGTVRWSVFEVIRSALSGDLRRIGSVLMKKSSFVVLACLWTFPASAQTTYTAKTCNLSDVSAAIASEQAAPVDGDIISIPAGTCTWTGSSPLSPPVFTHSVTIQGQGAISATGTNGSARTGSDVTVILDHLNRSGGNPSTTIYLKTVTGKSLRFTGVAFTTDDSSTATANGMLEITGTSTSVRVDRNHFVIVNGGVGLRIDGSVLGVADHNVFDSPTNSLTNDFAFHNGVGWNGNSETGGATGNYSWNDTDHFGTNRFFFGEDNLFNNGDIGDGGHDGSRYVLRHNTVQQTVTAGCPTTCSAGQMYNHGTPASPNRSMRAAEFYLNNIVQPGTTGIGNPPYSINGGTLMYWGNTVVGYKDALGIDYTRKDNSTYGYAPPPIGWGNCSTTGGDGWDGNAVSPSGYPCLDSPARGAGDLLSGDFPNICNLALNAACRIFTGQWPQQALIPIYVWNNSFTPAGGYSGVQLVSSISMFTDNTDYYQQFGTYGEPGTFNGTAGIGQGSSAPSTAQPTCTPSSNAIAAGTAWLGVSVSGNWGPGYWDTTNNTLYVCTATNTWTAYYQPYTYPHPLTGGTSGETVNPPTGLVATVQ